MRTSYLPNEILWGHRLTPLVTYQKENGHYTIDHKQFHNAIPVSIPTTSARVQAETLTPPRTFKQHSHDVTPTMTSLNKYSPTSAVSFDGTTSFTNDVTNNGTGATAATPGGGGVSVIDMGPDDATPHTANQKR